MVSIKKIKQQMDALIRGMTPEGSKKKVYIGYQFPIANPRIIRKKRGELLFTSSVRGQLFNFKFQVNDYKIPKIKDILLTMVSSSEPEKKIQLKKNLEE